MATSLAQQHKSIKCNEQALCGSRLSESCLTLRACLRDHISSPHQPTVSFLPFASSLAPRRTLIVVSLTIPLVLHRRYNKEVKFTLKAQREKLHRLLLTPSPALRRSQKRSDLSVNPSYHCQPHKTLRILFSCTMPACVRLHLGKQMT